MIIKIFILSFLFILLHACSSVENIEGKNKAHTQYLRGKTYFEKASYDAALEKFNKVKTKYPYSKYAILSELKIAESYYHKSKLIESHKLFTLFAELHPKHPKEMYALYMSGMSLFKMIPESEDRDITISPEALETFEKIIDKGGINSLFFEKALNKISEIRQKQAEQIIYIANYYKKKEKYPQAIRRYLQALKEFKSLKLEEKLYPKLSESYKKIGDIENSKKYSRF